MLEQTANYIRALAFMNLVETALNVYYVYAQHILASPSAPLIGFASAVMTLSKTVLYWLQEYYCGGCAVGHNDAFTLFWFWIVPNGYVDISLPFYLSYSSVLTGSGCSYRLSSFTNCLRISRVRCGSIPRLRLERKTSVSNF